MTTPILELDEWEESQAQPYVTVNEALRWLECFATLSVIDADETDPSSLTPADGDVYIVGGGATGDWAGHDQEIALRIGSAWAFRLAPPGKIAFFQDEGVHYYFEGGPSGMWVLLVNP